VKTIALVIASKVNEFENDRKEKVLYYKCSLAMPNEKSVQEIGQMFVPAVGKDVPSPIITEVCWAELDLGMENSKKGIKFHIKEICKVKPFKAPETI